MINAMTGLLLVVMVACLPRAVLGQEEIQQRQAELEQLRGQIQELETRSRVHQQNENETLELLDTYDRKGTLVRRLITKLRADERRMQTRIEATRAQLSVLEDQLAFLKDHYARYVTSVYKTGRHYDAELLFTSSSLTQFAVRNQYLRRFSDQRRKDAERIREKQHELEEFQARAAKDLSEERRLIAEKGAEEDRLATLAKERRRTLDKIRKDKSMLARELARQVRSAREMETMIARLVEAERMRKAKATVDRQLPRLPQPAIGDAEFERKKGRLRWPVPEGNIVARFGPQRHPTLRTVTQNTGIDIAVRPGTSVTAVAPGEVATIWWLPTYGNLVILNHQNGYRTVYTHLADVDVIEGQVVNEGDVIGSSGDTLEGPRLHFEVWKDREKQNPEQWLMRQ